MAIAALPMIRLLLVGEQEIGFCPLEITSPMLLPLGEMRQQRQLRLRGGYHRSKFKIRVTP
jgi:hypothetical protein